MNSKNKKSSARALFVGHLGAVGLGSMMDIPDDTGMQWSMYVHRVRSEDTTHTTHTTHTHYAGVAIGRMCLSVAFLGSRKKKKTKKQCVYKERFGGFWK